MKYSYKFSNLLGTVYRRGDVIFSNDGNSVLCPVGNKISIYDLRNNRAHTLPIEARCDYTTLALSPNGMILIAAQEGGEVDIINLNYRSVLYSKRFNRPIKSIHFSPDGKHFALTKENGVFVYNTPGSSRRLYDPFVLERTYHATCDDTLCLDWSFDSKILAVGSRDMTARVYAFSRMQNLRFHTVGGNTDSVVGVFFEEKSLDFYTVSRNGHVISWECSLGADELIPAKDVFRKKTPAEVEEEDPMVPPEEGADGKSDDNAANVEDTSGKFFYKLRLRMYLDKHLGGRRVTVGSCTYHRRTRLLTVACGSGDFLLLDMNDEGAVVHSLNISDQTITSVSMNITGDWIALGVSSVGQLLVWEWQSETYVLKQQGHFSNMRVVAYSPDGAHIATGGEDGKVKLWSTQSSFCFVTFTEHTGTVTGLAFTQSGRAIISSSVDGSVRAFDLTRYRNFKTLTSPKPTQFSCIAVDSSGELVAAGGQDSHDIFLWSLQNGRLLEVLAGHEGPVVSLCFSSQPGSTMMVSTGWDSTVRVWDAIAATTAKETISISSDGLFVTLRPDGLQLAVATLDGQVTFFNPSTGQQEGNITGRSDLGAGRSDSDKITAKKNLQAKAFTTLCYSADGKCILAGGQSKHVCIYSIAEELLMKRFEITQNRSFDAMDDIINRRKLAQDGTNLALIEDRDEPSGQGAIKLPGTRSGDMSQRAFRPEVRVSSISFSPTGRSWAASSSEGLLVYSLDNDWLFDPLSLDISNTPTAVKQHLMQKDYSTALMMSIRLNIKHVKQEVLENIPLNAVPVIINNLPQLYVEGILAFIAEALESTRHVGLYAEWVRQLTICHGASLKSRASQVAPMLNALQRALTSHCQNLSKVCHHNEYTISYLLAQSSLKSKRRKTDVLGVTSTSDPEREMECLFSDDNESIDDEELN